MVRVTYGAPRHQKKVRWFKQAKGFRGGRSKLWRTVRESVDWCTILVCRLESRFMTCGSAFEPPMARSMPLISCVA